MTTPSLVQYTVVRIAREGQLPPSAISAESVAYLLKTNTPAEVVRMALGKPRSATCVHGQETCGICHCEARQ